MENILVQTEQLTKAYGPHTVVDQVNLTIQRGDIYGFLGQNGAGKTTTLRMIVGLVKPTSGTVHLFNTRNPKQAVLERVGTMIDMPGFYKNLTVSENLAIHCELIGLKDPTAIERCLHQIGLWEARNKTVRKLSMGMRQRLAIGRAIIHQPELLLLDEPTNGLDPVGIREIRELLLQLSRQQQITLLVSSHLLSEIDQLATRIGIIHHGKLLQEIDTSILRQRMPSYLELKIVEPSRTLFILEQHLGIAKYELSDPGTIRLYEHVEDSAEIIRTLVMNGVQVIEAVRKNASLEDYFIDTISTREASYYAQYLAL
ncbi:ABC transporter ATP-binding protein [Paenibacillus sp. PR3]|uniref:ABC transporter ATP-binding protein n=1 Tax=Paenibacillus terricola TaxID=2763503 RepID=A0ABR8N2C4_9BACL|nr:ABC transporter ATP-binding protein [Paenibacillus terricola]